ncbi:LysR family transcriptional regulator [Bacterioplanes sanyensis]|uniref:LysR family transcriptional regulator n=1 Tax=Bacterioplanes sanyensis TaxID=1249553 RepID=A0A222FIZ3_9GAMM|nr:LysR family transcriptional regulator [Bacterioplanes sanyensis]ASP38719.1 LysR family transcriptional regulator [Bacterioplanes sanyensis]
MKLVLIMQKMDIGSVDLNLLKLFDALLKEGSVTAAAARIGLSQPAASRGLGRLRRLLNDRILVRTANGWELTPRALSLSANVAKLLDDVSAIIAPTEFAPQQVTGKFTIASADHLAQLFMPDLIAKLAQLAPGLDITITTAAGDNVDLVSQGGADLAIGSYQQLPARFYCKQLYEDDFVCVVRRDHAISQKPLTLEDYVAWPHISVSITGHGSSAVDEVLKQHNKRRRVAVKTPYFLLAPSIVANTDLILTTPRRLAEHMMRSETLALQELPLTIPSIAPSMIWHERLHYDPAHIWLRQQVMELAVTLTAP